VAAGDAFVLLRLHAMRGGVPVSVEAVRLVQTQSEAERAVRRLNDENTDGAVEYGWTVASVQANGEFAFGIHTRDPDEDTMPWAPEHNQDQLCAFCEAGRPLYVHRLDRTQREFRVGGDARTWPTFLATCARCEALVLNGDDPALLRLMTWEDDDMSRTAALSAFRASDLGSEPLPEGPPDTARP
jgi:hypothetical protein